MEHHPEPQWRTPAAYHVFISHRGPDVKKSLASLIYHRLTNCHGLRVFLDKNEIRTGDTISDAILTAIQSASVYITIFSKGYAESRWCLEELYWILRSHHKCNKKVIPVFCNVNPADLRYTESGCYKNAFDHHQSKGRVSPADMEKWRKALSQAADISGIFFKPKESDHGEILEEIVGIVLKEVFKWGSLDVAKYPVGLDHAAEDPLINEILKQSDFSDTMIVGISGMSGIGKTTLAKYIYNLRRPSFNGRSCFLSNVRLNELPKLRGKLLSDLLGYNQDLQDIDSIEARKHLLQRYRILLVLDDVDNINQIDALLDLDAVGRGSLILITACYKDVMRRSSLKTLFYDVKPLNRQHARELFCQHAFRQFKPSDEFEDLVEEFLEICQGLPLSLKVLGGHFVGMSDKDYWKQQLKRFSTTLHEDILQTLKVSYDALNGDDKEAFLDIGCFLVGEETGLAIRVLEGLYGSNIVHSLERLHQKCLVDFHYNVQSDDEIECRKPEDPMIGYDDLSLKCRGYKLAMHDQLRRLARHIAPLPLSVNTYGQFRDFHGLPLRITFERQDRGLPFRFLPKLGNCQGTSHLPIRGIRTLKDWPLDFAFFNFRGECTHIFVVEVPVDLSSVLGSWKLTEDLVWVRLRNFRFGSTRSHPSIPLRKLTVLELEGERDNIDQFFEIFDLADMDLFPNKPNSRLNELTISGMDDEVPTTSSNNSTRDAGPSMKVSENYISSAVQQGGVMPHLCRFLKWTGLENLCKMVLRNLTSLQYLPVDFGELARLRHLDLSGCTNLTELPKSFSKLLHLQYLALRECRNLSIPPYILGRISTLEYVDFKGCAQLVALPDGIPYQTDLRYLNLLFTSLSQLPEDVEQLGNLKQLRIGSPELTRFPRCVANLRGLTELMVIQCRHLQCLSPEGIAAPNIKILTIDCCPIASFSFRKDQRTMGVLRDLTLKRTSISEICMVEGVYRWLQTIDLSENIQLKQVIALPSTIVRVNLQNCWELDRLESLSSLVNLKILNINGCFSVETLNLRGLLSLQVFEAEKCWNLKRIDGLSCLNRLNYLTISTDDGIFWKDVWKIWKSAPSDGLSKCILSGKVDDEMDEEQMQRTISQLEYRFYTKRVNIASNTNIQDYRPRPWIDFRNLHGLILWFITDDIDRCSFRVNFYDYNDCNVSAHECISHGGKRGGRKLHVFMWTRYSKLFKDCRERVFVDCSCDASASELEKVLTGKGWLLMVDNHKDFLEVCNKLCTPKHLDFN